MATVIGIKGILVASALHKPAKNTDKDRLEYYASVAYPPEVLPHLQKVFKDADCNVRPSLRRNRDRDVPYADIPSDWIILRAWSGVDYPPALYDKNGLLPPAMSNSRNSFVAGSLVYLEVYPFTWEYKNRQGASLCVVGVADTGEMAQGNFKSGGSDASSMLSALNAGTADAGNPARHSTMPVPDTDDFGRVHEESGMLDW